jgi:hypothetical protein
MLASSFNAEAVEITAVSREHLDSSVVYDLRGLALYSAGSCRIEV